MPKDILDLPWVKFNKVIMKLNYDQLDTLVARERAGRSRMSYLLRLMGRRNRQERVEMVRGDGK